MSNDRYACVLSPQLSDMLQLVAFENLETGLARASLFRRVFIMARRQAEAYRTSLLVPQLNLYRLRIFRVVTFRPVGNIDAV